MKDRPNLPQGHWAGQAAIWAGYLSEIRERSVTTGAMNQIFDRRSSQVRMMKFRAFAEITADDHYDLQDGYWATPRWGRHLDKAAEANCVAPDPADLERLIDRQERVKNYRQ